MVVYLALSGLHFLVSSIIITLKGLHLLSMGVVLRIGQLSNKALKGRNRNLLQFLSTSVLIMMRCVYLVRQLSMLWIIYLAPSGLRVMG